MNRLSYISISTNTMRTLKIYTSAMTTSRAFALLLCLTFILSFCGIACAATTLTQINIDSGAVSGDTAYIINTNITTSSSALYIGTSTDPATLTITDGATFTVENTSFFEIYDTMYLENGTFILQDNAILSMSTESNFTLTNSTLTVGDTAKIEYLGEVFVVDSSSATFSGDSKTLFDSGIDAANTTFTVSDNALLYTTNNLDNAIGSELWVIDTYGDMNFSSGSTVTINGGTVYSANDINFDSTSNLIVAGDLFTSSDNYAIYVDGSLNVQDGSTLTITGLSGAVADGTQRLYIVNADADGDGKDGSGSSIASTEDTANTWDTVTFTNPYVVGTGQYIVEDDDYVVDYYFISSGEPAVDDLIDDPRLSDSSTYLYNVTHDQDNLHSHLVSSSHMALLGGVYNNIYSIATLASRAIRLESSLEEGMSVWALPMAYSEEARSFNLNGVNVGYDSDLLGLSFGVDYSKHNTFVDRVRLGIASHLGEGTTKSVGDFIRIENEFDFWGASVYADLRKGNFDLNTKISYFETSNNLGQATASYFDYSMNDLTADVNARMLTFESEIMYTYKTQEYGEFIPFAGIRYSILEVGNHFIWNGDEEVYSVKKDHEDIISIPLGLRYKYEKITEDNNLICPTAYASVVFTNAKTNTQAFLVGTYAESSYTVSGDIEFLDPVYFEAGVGVQWSDKKNWNLGLNYDAQISQHRTSHGLAASVRYTF